MCVHGEMISPSGYATAVLNKNTSLDIVATGGYLITLVSSTPQMIMGHVSNTLKLMVVVAKLCY